MSVAATGAVLNFVVIIAMAIDPLKILRKGPWLTILNLAIADFISCISCFFLWGVIFFIPKSELYDDITIIGWGFGSSASFLWLTFLSVQIFAITKFPLKSRHWFTALKIVLVGIAVWLFAFLLGLSLITYRFHLPLTINLKIWTAKMGVLQIALVIQIVLNIQVAIEIIRSGRSTGNPQNAKHKNIAKTVIILTLILFLTAFPYFLFKQLELLARLGYFDQDETARVLHYLSYYYAPIAMLNFAANPILYALRLPDYRQTLLAFVGKTRSSQLTNAFSLKSQKINMSEISERHTLT
ncbi:somatostatin receptor type 5 [Paramuricea clavata]|uniref:Somatostatin receptor type 5 n=1 Tax=Paramuricea clavata TaxID=317549 RepID=A0A7D9IL31_PARCT|nr:somatostatin receptor type 5 [Paramuricea clavata]